MEWVNTPTGPRPFLIVHMTKGQKVLCTGFGCTHTYHDPSAGRQ